jgi:hypothetical protein
MRKLTEWTSATEVRKESNMNSFLFKFILILIIVFSGCSILKKNPPSAPSEYSVSQNDPNPFGKSTNIDFSIPKAGKVTDEIYDLRGRKVYTVADKIMTAGAHSVTWDASGFEQGVYFYVVKSGEFSRTMKMTHLQ